MSSEQLAAGTITPINTSWEAQQASRDTYAHSIGRQHVFNNVGRTARTKLCKPALLMMTKRATFIITIPGATYIFKVMSIQELSITVNH
jgi:hypothetical protein